MALIRSNTYPGRFSAPTTEHPQGAFKNRSAPGAQDGSYLEQQWANDMSAFPEAILTAAGVTPNGTEDTATNSQVFDALTSLVRSYSTGVVGQSRNVRMNVTTASATGTLTADEIIVETSAGLQYKLKTFSKTINLATTGAGGMDTGTVPATGFVGLYAIYNPTTHESALLAVDATSVIVPEIYAGSNLPSGYTASALLVVLPVASSQFPLLAVSGRNVSIVSVSVMSGSAAPGAVNSQVITQIPLNSVSVDLASTIGIVGNDTTGVFTLAATSGLIAGRLFTLGAAGTGGTLSVTSNFTLPIVSNARTLYWRITSANLSYGVTTVGYSV